MAQSSSTSDRAQSMLKIAFFRAAGDGYLVAFAGEAASSAESARAQSEATQAIAALNPWHRSWLPQLQAWWIADDAITLLAKRIPVLAEVLDQWLHRPIDATYIGETSWKAEPGWFERLLGTRLRLPSDIVTAYYQLELLPGATAEEVRVARRRLARRHHPDTGGDHDAMARINSAADRIVDWLRQQ